MGTYTTKHKAGDSIFYIGPDFRAKRGEVHAAMVQETRVVLSPATHPQQSFATNPDGSYKTETYVQYMIDGQYMPEERVFSSIEDLMEHVRGDSK